MNVFRSAAASGAELKTADEAVTAAAARLEKESGSAFDSAERSAQ